MPTRRGNRFRRRAEAPTRLQTGSQLGREALQFLEVFSSSWAAAKPAGRGFGVEIF
jgi:hypothetical protein